MIADARQAGLAGIGLVAAQPLGQPVTDLEVLGLLRGTEGQEQLGIHAERSGLQAEADQQRGALHQSGIDAPGAAAPRSARGLARRLGEARRIEAVPRDVGLRIPGQALGLAVQLAERRHLRRELQRETALDEPFLLRLVRTQQPRRVIARLAHPQPPRQMIPVPSRFSLGVLRGAMRAPGPVTFPHGKPTRAPRRIVEVHSCASRHLAAPAR